MSETSEKARAAMKAKAKRLAEDRPMEKVASADWSPPAMLKAGVQTGMRPVSPRAYKRGGKVQGEHAQKRADRAPRKAGGKAEMPLVDRYINRDNKKANEFRDGEKHTGGMKKGGAAHHRKHRDEGGRTAMDRIKDAAGYNSPDYSPKTDPNYKPDNAPSQSEKDALAKMSGTTTRKSGGRTKKMDGGPMGAMMGPVGGANAMMQKASGVAGVPSALMGFNHGASRLSHAAGLKKGGKAEGHPDVAADKALIKKMVKPSARTGHARGGSTYGVAPTMRLLKTHSEGGNSAKVYKNPDTGEHQVKFFKDGVHQKKADYFADDPSDAHETAQESLKRGFNAGGRTGRATGGQVFSGPGYPGKVPGAVPGGRTARATGGKTKGKTDINIIINAEKGGQPGMMPPGAPPMGAPKGMPVPVPPAPGGMPPGMPMGMMPPGMMPPGGAPPMAPPGVPPMGRKSGGRTYSSYKDMDAGSGGAKARIEKTEIARKHSGIQKQNY